MEDVESDVFFSTVLSQGEVNTQKIESQETLSEDIVDDDDSRWATLLQVDNSNFESIALKKDSYTCGRSPKCDIIIKEENMKNTLTIEVISKVQFRIAKEQLSDNIEVVKLEDLSMNGTFVNKMKVGKGKKVELTNGDKIALSNPHNEVYAFVLPSDKNWIPVEMKQIYYVKIFLGSGTYGEVRLALNKVSGKHVAIKKVKKREGGINIFNEVKILQNLKHPCIVSMENVFDTSDSLFIVLEFISGGELASWIRKVTKLSDGEAKAIFYQLVLAFQYLHYKGVAHRDLKPENVLLSVVGNEGEKLVKVSDFGLSKLADSKTVLKTFCGTPLYAAPEILKTQGTGCYTHQVDVWSLGVILFQCLSGKLPFNRVERQPAMRLTEQIIRGYYSMAGEEWKGVSPNAMKLIRSMLQTNPDKRIRIGQILDSPWLQDAKMKTKINSLIKNISPDGDENLCLDPMQCFKRRRLNEEDDTFFRS